MSEIVRLVVPPLQLPVSLEEARMHLRIDAGDEDGLVTSLIGAATAHLDGWTGILGCCLEEQTWKVSFDRWGRCMRLPLGPVIKIVSVQWAGQSSPETPEGYELHDDGIGPLFAWRPTYQAPSDVAADALLTVTYRAGYRRADGKSAVPEPLRVAILLLVSHWFHNRDAVAEGSFSEMPMSVKALIGPYRRMRL